MNYDVIIVGGGHAGVEAAAAASRVGVNAALISLDKNALARLSCNPAMGGTAKGQLIREIDALDGLMPVATDLSAIQYRMLNRSKGPAVWSPRAQVDRDTYTQQISQLLAERYPEVDIIEDEAVGLVTSNQKTTGVECKNSGFISASKIVLCSGTFLRGLVHVGSKNWSSGRYGEDASNDLSDSLRKQGFELRRFKTGTPPRVLKDSVNLDILERQDTDDEEWFFSQETKERHLPQECCWRVYSNQDTHNYISERITESPLYNGTITSTGPRYCPSIEDKIVRFPDRDRHPLVFEPEGINHPWLYLNGFSSSLPEETQLKALRTLPGCENAEIGRPAYAIEYDVVPAAELRTTLETRRIQGLYLAGQISGTSGYEEAGVLGLLAGANAALSAKKEDPIVLTRSDSYIGVLVDDLVTLDPDEPYRMFTSRAEYRLLLRQDNAEERLSEKAYTAGLVSEERINSIRERIASKDSLVRKLKSVYVPRHMVLKDDKDPEKVESAAHLLKRPEITLELLVNNLNGKLFADGEYSCAVQRAAEIEIVYEGYLERQQREIERLREQENLSISEDFEYSSIPGLSAEARLRLEKHRPATLGQASRLAGVTPSDLAILMIHIKRKRLGLSHAI